MVNYLLPTQIPGVRFAPCPHKGECMSDDYKNLFIVGMNKGEWDFSIRATIQDLSIDEMQELRAMIMAAVGTAEDMWRRGQVQETSGVKVKANM